ncbi:Uncharacterised protein [Amycolatopsis camponoti]|uniref:Uncharacterized protein n=1 Tax=Amycolatopsis camponoti TaxID=2606593 RepID=A0A6I8LKR3_9PSEU|nr:Uncharacterised protein [Amycolatopsis camponoti]
MAGCGIGRVAGLMAAELPGLPATGAGPIAVGPPGLLAAGLPELLG